MHYMPLSKRIKAPEPSLVLQLHQVRTPVQRGPPTNLSSSFLLLASPAVGSTSPCFFLLPAFLVEHLPPIRNSERKNAANRLQHHSAFIAHATDCGLSMSSQIMPSFSIFSVCLFVSFLWGWKGGGGGGVLIIFLGRGVPPGTENPYPISDQNIRFSVPYFRPDSQNVYHISGPVRCGNFSNSQWIYGTSWRPKRCATHVTLKMASQTKHGIYTLFQAKMAKSIPYLRQEMLENGTLWDGTYLFGSYMGVPPPLRGVKENAEEEGRGLGSSYTLTLSGCFAAGNHPGWYERRTWRHSP